MMLKVGVAMLATIIGSATNATTTRFVCTSPSGQALYPDDIAPKWAPDKISGGIIELTVADDKSVSLHVLDVRGQVYDPSADGAVLNQTSDKELDVRSYVSVLAVFPLNGIQDTYTVVGGKRLLWTVARDGKTSGQTTKVAAYTATCSVR